MENYIPIDCNFYDELESRATLRKLVVIEYSDSNISVKKTVSRIVNLFVKDKVEYMKTEHGAIIRLDKLISVDNIALPKVFDTY